jgi:hypothetical protein
MQVHPWKRAAAAVTAQAVRNDPEVLAAMAKLKEAAARHGYGVSDVRITYEDDCLPGGTDDDVFTLVLEDVKPPRPSLTEEELRTRAALIGTTSDIKVLEQCSPEMAAAFRARHALRMKPDKEVEDPSRGPRPRPIAELQAKAMLIQSMTISQALRYIDRPEMADAVDARVILRGRMLRGASPQ